MGYIELDGDHAMFEVQIPENWIGRTIGQIDIRKKYSINIIGVRKNGELDMSLTSDTILENGSTMLVLGRYKELQKCFRI